MEDYERANASEWNKSISALEGQKSKKGARQNDKVIAVKDVQKPKSWASVVASRPGNVRPNVPPAPTLPLAGPSRDQNQSIRPPVAHSHVQGALRPGQWSLLGAKSKGKQFSSVTAQNQSFESAQAGNFRFRRPENWKSQRRPTLAVDADNDAKAAWRKNDAPAKTLRLPHNFDPAEQRKSERSLRTAPAFPRVEQIAKQTATHIAVSAGKNESRIFLNIWGSPSQVDVAVKQINDWIKEVGSQHQGGKWAKLYNLSDRQKRRLERKLRQEEEQNLYKRNPQEGAVFGWTGFFLWPKEDYNPEEIFGRNCEALDPIRTSSCAYIVWHASPTCFKIDGRNEGHVAKVMGRLNKTYCQILAREFANMGMRYYVVKVPARDLTGMNVQLEPYIETPIQSSKDLAKEIGRTPRLCGPSLDAEDWKKGSASTWAKQMRNKKRILSKTMDTLGKLRLYRGALKMRVHLGCFVLTSYKRVKDDTYTFPEFVDMMGQDQVRGFVTQELGQMGLENQLLHRVCGAKALLTPREAMTLTLEDAKPVYCGRFILHHPDGGGKHVCLEVEFQETEDHYDRVLKRWFRFDGEAKKASQVLDLSHVDLESGLTWHFGITAQTKLEDANMPEHYLEFAENITLDLLKARDTQSSQQFLHFLSNGQLSVPVVSVQQGTAWRFNFSNSDFICEVAKVQRFEIETALKSHVSVAPGQASTREKGEEKADAENQNNSAKFSLAGRPMEVYEPRWTLQVWSNRWDICLDQNADLKVGESVLWHANEATFFPLDGAPQISPLGGLDSVEPSEADFDTGAGAAQAEHSSVAENAENPIDGMPSRGISSHGSLRDRGSSNSREIEDRWPGFDAFYTRLRKLEAAVRDEECRDEDADDVELEAEVDDIASDNSDETYFTDEDDFEVERNADHQDPDEHDQLAELQRYFGQKTEQRDRSHDAKTNDAISAEESGAENSTAGYEADVEANVAGSHRTPAPTVPAPVVRPPKIAANLFDDDWAMNEDEQPAGWEGWNSGKPSQSGTRPGPKPKPQPRPQPKLGRLIDIN